MSDIGIMMGLQCKSIHPLESTSISKISAATMLKNFVIILLSRLLHFYNWFLFKS